MNPYARRPASAGERGTEELIRRREVIRGAGLLSVAGGATAALAERPEMAPLGPEQTDAYCRLGEAIRRRGRGWCLVDLAGPGGLWDTRGSGGRSRKYGYMGITGTGYRRLAGVLGDAGAAEPCGEYDEVVTGFHDGPRRLRNPSAACQRKIDERARAAFPPGPLPGVVPPSGSDSSADYPSTPEEAAELAESDAALAFRLLRFSFKIAVLRRTGRILVTARPATRRDGDDANGIVRMTRAPGDAAAVDAGDYAIMREIVRRISGYASADMIRTRCPECGRRRSMGAALAWREWACRGCRVVLRMSAPYDPADALPGDEDGAAVVARRPPRRKRRAAGGEVPAR